MKLTKGFLNFHPNIALEMQCKHVPVLLYSSNVFFIMTNTLKELRNCRFMFLASISVYLPKIVKIVYCPIFSNKSPDFWVNNMGISMTMWRKHFNTVWEGSLKKWQAKAYDLEDLWKLWLQSWTQLETDITLHPSNHVSRKLMQ